MSETMWAPWRMEYIVGPKIDGCVFCDAWSCAPEDKKERLVLASAKSTFVIMNRYPYSHGHILICPERHAGRLDDLSKEEQDEFFSMLMLAQRAVNECLCPQGMNIGMNIGKVAGAGIEDHLHAHILPRWVGDTNFMPMLADVKVMPEHLNNTYEALLAAFEKLSPQR